MHSDRFLFKQADVALDKIELFASCYEFKKRDVLHIRLLAEEIISVISPTLSLSDGRCWVTTDDKSFAVTIDCDASISAMDEATRQKLLKMSRPEKSKGVFGMIGKVFEFLSAPDVDYNSVTGHRMIYPYGAETGMSGYYWDPEFISVANFNEPVSSKKAQEDKDLSLEMSIIEGFADDIRVSLERAKTGVRLEITVVKHFAAGQVSGIEF